MAELIDINNEKFWDILFDEACVEGQQAERIEKELKKIATTEAEIRNKAIEEFTSKICEKYTSEEEKSNYKQYCSQIKQDIAEIAEQMKGEMKE